MSYVTSVVIICPTHCEHIYGTKDKWIAKVNGWLKENYSYAQEGCALFENITDNINTPPCAGTKHPQSCVYIGGFNYFPDAEFSEFFKTLKWPKANLLIRNEDWDDSPHLAVPKLTDEDYLYTPLEYLDKNTPDVV